MFFSGSNSQQSVFSRILKSAACSFKDPPMGSCLHSRIHSCIPVGIYQSSGDSLPPTSISVLFQHCYFQDPSICSFPFSIYQSTALFLWFTPFLFRILERVAKIVQPYSILQSAAVISKIHQSAAALFPESADLQPFNPHKNGPFGAPM